MSSANSWTRLKLLGCTAMTAGLLASPNNALADDGPPETVVISGTLFNPDAAPAKASTDATEPQTIIGRSYIEDSVAPTADYVTILAITPSLTGTDINGPGLSEGSVKNTLRGLPDGSYGMTYDGIPFGDTNGPSHHSASYFPGSTIGAIEVERGPGNAGNLGAATYGGSINMYSEPLVDQMRAAGAFSYGSFNTANSVVNLQTGDISGLGHTRALVDLQNTNSDGALSLQTFRRNTALLKVESQIAPDWKITLFSTYTALHENLNDNNGATPAQIAMYGKSFALQNSNPALPTFAGYNFTNKWTDMDYLRVAGNLSSALKAEETIYTYAYVNKTLTARNITQTITDINNNIAEGMGGKSAPIVGGVKQLADIPGYTKLNAFRVWGSILRISADYEIGSLTGQIRAGLWAETASTPRSRFDFDSNLCYQNSINPFNDASAACQDSSLASQGKAVLTAGHGNPHYNGYAEYLEHSSWQQYEPFTEVDIRPIEDLTLTPGLKYIDWTHSTRSTIEPKLLTPLTATFKTTRTLPFFTVNYKIRPSWSVYAQYAQGIYVPDISAFEQSSPVFAFPKAQTTTNYQFGTVYYGDNFTFDADVYYIPVNNNIVFQDCALPPVNGLKGDTCGVNTGQAVYKGIEGEGTYAFNDSVMNGWLNGLVAFVNGSINSGKSQGLYLKQAPTWTAATGLIYKRNGVKVALIDKAVGPQYSDNGDNPNYKVHAYNNMDLTLGYDFGRFEADFGIYNLLNSRDVLAITENDKTFQANRLNSADQYFFKPERSFMFTLKAAYSPG